MSATEKTWTPTRFQNLYRHKSGTYYVRVGRRTWKSLRTKVQSVALKRRDEVLVEEERKVEFSAEALDLGGELVRHLIAYRKEQIKNDTAIKQTTRDFWNHVFVSLQRSWPELPGKKAAEVSALECERWAGRYAEEVSASLFNNTLGGLKKLFDLAIEAGLRQTNPTARIKRRKAAKKDLTSRLPDQKTFALWIEEIRNSPSRWGKACAELVEFLSYSGLRIGEATWVEWRHCDFERGEIVVEGNPTLGTKNRQIRRVPMIEDMKDLLERMQEWRTHEEPTERVLLVKSAKDAMNRAAEKVGMEPLTHHDLRHFFATTCIESGVDVPTVSKWLGHKDGGALAMRVYGHLRNEHSLAEAKKVSFSKNTASPPP